MPQMSLNYSSLLGFLVMFSVSCQQQTPPDTSESMRQHQAPILGGQDSGAEHDFAVLIRTFSSGSLGTGVLVAPNLVFTALHGVVDYQDDSKGFDCTKDGLTVYSLKDISDLQVFVGPNRPSLKATPPSPIKKIIPFPSTDICKGDLAFLLLENPIPDAKITSLRLESPVQIGEQSFSVGWGVIDTYGSTPKVRQFLGGIKVLALGPGQYKAPDGLISFEMTPNVFISTAGPCSGDSGSGLFSQQTGALLGLLSYGGTDDPNFVSTPDEPYKFCLKSTLYYSRLDVAKDFILGAFKEAGHRPWLEGQPRPGTFGAVCEAEGECDSKLCVAGVCSASCADAPCPETFSCEERDGAKVCVSGSGAAGSSGAGGQASAQPQGAACTAPADCASGLCITVESSSVCSARCDQAACADGWECTEQGGQKICLPPTQMAPSESGCAMAPPVRQAEAFSLGLLAALSLLLRRRSSR
jgi:hypothetical protein